MMTHAVRTLKRTLFILVCLSLSGCFEKVTRGNFERIEKGMDRDEVVAILGEPDDSTAVKLGALNGETAYWIGGGHRIVVSFAQGTVVLATFGQSGDKAGLPGMEIEP